MKVTLGNIYVCCFQGLRVRHGTQERVFRLEFVSNQEFTESEYNKWIDASAAAGIPMPTRENIQQKQSDIKEALHYEFNEQDIERIVSTKLIQKLLLGNDYKHVIFVLKHSC